MRLTRTLIIVLAITLLATLYVYQQSKVIHLAYRGQERLAFLERLVDEKNNLEYNLNRRMSLISIAGILQEGDFEWPHRKQLLSLSNIQQTPEDNKQIGKTESIFTRFFGLKSQAEATSLKPR